MVGEVFQTRLHPPVVLAHDKDEGIGGANFRSQCFHRNGRFTLRILFVHSIQHRQSDDFRINELGRLTACAETCNNEVG